MRLFLALCNAENSARSCNLCFGKPLTLGYNLKLPRYLSKLGFYHSSYLKSELTSKLPTCATRHIIICFIHFKSPEVKNNCLQQVDCNTVTPHNSTHPLQKESIRGMDLLHLLQNKAPNLYIKCSTGV